MPALTLVEFKLSSLYDMSCLIYPLITAEVRIWLVHLWQGFTICKQPAIVLR
jgi:hypothetical protein